MSMSIASSSSSSSIDATTRRRDDPRVSLLFFEYVAMFWGLKLEPGRWTPYVPPPDVHLRARVTRATMRETREDGTRVTVKMRCETDEAVLAGALGTKGEREDGDEDDEEDVFEEFRALSLIHI